MFNARAKSTDASRYPVVPSGMIRLVHRISERCWEWRLGINTRGCISPERLSCKSDSVQYSPVPFRVFFHMMKHVPRDLLSGTFVDYGAGRGRAMVLAAVYYGFPRVVGVEISPELCRDSMNNLEHVRARRAEISCADAATYDPPADASLFFFFNPFYGDTMKGVIHNIRKSFLKSPRRFAIAVCNPRNFREAALGEDWLIETASGEMLPSARWAIFTSLI